MRNMKFTAKLSNGKSKQSPILGIFDFIPFVQVSKKKMIDYKISKSDIPIKKLSNFLEEDKQCINECIICTGEKEKVTIKMDIVAGRTIYFSMDYSGYLSLIPYGVTILSNKELGVKINDSINVIIQSSSITEGAYIDFYAKDDDLVNTKEMQNLHCGRLYINVELDCRVVFASDLSLEKKNIVSPTTIKLLKKAASKTNNKLLKITSTIRYPKDQARAMYTNLKNGKNIRYRDPGQQVVAVFHQYQNENKTKEETIQAMINKIEDLAEKGLRVSLHCVSLSVYSKCNVLDVSFRGGSAIFSKELILELEKDENVTKVIHPILGVNNSSKVKYDTGEEAIHIEIKQ